jgi:hypothetical protein
MASKKRNPRVSSTYNPFAELNGLEEESSNSPTYNEKMYFKVLNDLECTNLATLMNEHIETRNTIKTDKKKAEFWSYKYNIPDPFMSINEPSKGSFNLLNIEDWYAKLNPNYLSLGKFKETLVVDELITLFKSTVKDLLIVLCGSLDESEQTYLFPHNDDEPTFIYNNIITIDNDYLSYELQTLKRKLFIDVVKGQTKPITNFINILKLKKNAESLLQRANKILKGVFKYFEVMEYLMDYLNFFTTGSFTEKYYCTTIKKYILELIATTPYIIYPTTVMPIYYKWLYITKVPVLNMLFTNGRHLSHNAFMPACYQIDHDIRYHGVYTHKLNSLIWFNVAAAELQPKYNRETKETTNTEYEEMKEKITEHIKKNLKIKILEKTTEKKLADISTKLLKQRYHNNLINEACYKQYFFNSTNVMKALLPSMTPHINSSEISKEFKSSHDKYKESPKSSSSSYYSFLKEDDPIKKFIRSLYVFLFLHESNIQYLTLDRLINENTFYDNYIKKIKETEPNKDPVEFSKYSKYLENSLRIVHNYYPPLMIEQFRILFLLSHPFYEIDSPELNNVFNEVFSEAYCLLHNITHDPKQPNPESGKYPKLLLELAPLDDVVNDVMEIFKNTILKDYNSNVEDPKYKYEIPKVDFKKHTVTGSVIPIIIDETPALSTSVNNAGVSSAYKLTTYKPIKTLYENTKRRETLLSLRKKLSRSTARSARSARSERSDYASKAGGKRTIKKTKKLTKLHKNN